MAYVRQNINGTSPLDIKNMNDNMMNLWQKVFGDIAYGDVQTAIKKMLHTNWLQPQLEGNIDDSHPLIYRFYVPPNTIEVKEASLNAITSRYRMDSAVAESSNEDIKITGKSRGVGTGTASGVGKASGSTGSGGASCDIRMATEFVKIWGQSFGSIKAPTAKIMDYETFQTECTPKYDYLVYNDKAGLRSERYTQESNLIDLFPLNHQHFFTITQSPHYHDVNIDMDVDLNVDVTVDVTTDITAPLPKHTHPLRKAIIDAETAPMGIKIFINENQVGYMMNGDNSVQNNIDIQKYIKIGGWNIIKITSSNIARITIYGIIKLIEQI